MKLDLLTLLCCMLVACGSPQRQAAEETKPLDAAAEMLSAWPPVVAELPDVMVAKSSVLSVPRVPDLGSDNPYAEVWKKAPYFETPLMAQQMAMPILTAPSVPTLRVQALRDAERIAFRLSWPDATADGNVDSGRFSDAVALEFPLDAAAAPMMGHKGAKVQILHWKALWQKDLDVGFQDVQDLHPNYWYDLYWFAEGKFPFPIASSFKDPKALQWFVAQSAGNPMAVFSRAQPVGRAHRRRLWLAHAPARVCELRQRCLGQGELGGRDKSATAHVGCI